jgi:peptidoglycan/LPS O-acetylase OafA/YrhL
MLSMDRCALSGVTLFCLLSGLLIARNLERRRSSAHPSPQISKVKDSRQKRLRHSAEHMSLP